MIADDRDSLANRQPVAGACRRVTFEDHVRTALDSLPAGIAAALRNVAVVVEDENADDPDLFGLYEGVPLPERGDEAGSLPDRIAIYRRPLEEEFPDPADLEREIRITVLHELGHHFGLDEEQLAELGYE
jgi:predicted Zn-dependent protease with MMP-like domain